MATSSNCNVTEQNFTEHPTTPNDHPTTTNGDTGGCTVPTMSHKKGDDNHCNKTENCTHESREDKLVQDSMRSSMQSRQMSRKMWLTEKHVTQKSQHWPTSGKHILAQYDDNSIIVYQAFKPAIAEYSVKHQILGGADFSYNRMSWIKTNFLWMMYRCGWAEKHNQERVLAIRISQESFLEILRLAYSAWYQKEHNKSTTGILGGTGSLVRLQWDPDHSPAGGKLQRRAIQLGLKGEVFKRYSTELIQSIEDITPFVREQHRMAQMDPEELLVARERVYTITDPDIQNRLGLGLDSE